MTELLWIHLWRWNIIVSPSYNTSLSFLMSRQPKWV